MRSPATGGTTATAPNSAGKPGFDPDATPPPAVWQSGDDYKFVEEDDDEVMFRVRDSGVLRSLALPDITVTTPPALLEAGESTQDKQVPAWPSSPSFVRGVPSGHSPRLPPPCRQRCSRCARGSRPIRTLPFPTCRRSLRPRKWPTLRSPSASRPRASPARSCRRRASPRLCGTSWRASSKRFGAVPEPLFVVVRPLRASAAGVLPGRVAPSSSETLSTRLSPVSRTPRWGELARTAGRQ
jgi:hypothetical protein